MWARIHNGAVAELTDIDPKGRFHPSIKWESADASVSIGYFFDGNVYNKPEVPLADLVVEKLTELEQALSSALDIGMPYIMTDGTEEVVQTRPEDEPNLLGLAIEARDLRDAGETSAVQQLRVKSNKVYELTPLEMIEVTDAAKLHKKQLLGQSWALKDQVRGIVADEALTDEEKRAAIEEINW
ncbi:DUF4376 domain-containing protein [Billgrantia antri]|uniref:DUF4376 domain-containing protein n=1 Tax=Halomonas sulfidivorans TaxID=2733488 RepID=A0ABX7WN54_9GAMM|nr:DUF4376 domain-containing protein [Halomonas sulfidivorans]QTP60932.1 DUF4376 domain-containing protein [Halomonas sulfidivorans]